MDPLLRPSADDLCSDPSSQMEGGDSRSSVSARKVQKADREKMRRDKLNEQFQDLGSALDPDRPRNDKATVLGDAIQMIKDLTAQVSQLKAEYNALSEESRELAQEKNELKDELTALKSAVDNLKTEYQQRMRVMYPWPGVDPSAVMSPNLAYPFHFPVPISSNAVPVHSQMQVYPFYGNQSARVSPNPCSVYFPYPLPCQSAEQLPGQLNLPVRQSSSSRCHSATLSDSRRVKSTHPRTKLGEKNSDSGDVITELQLKTPGAAVPDQSFVADNKDSSSDGWRKNQHSGTVDSRDKGCASTSSCSEGHESSSSVEDG